MKNETMIVTNEFADTLEEQARAVREARAEHTRVAGVYRVALQRLKNAESALAQSFNTLHGPPTAEGIPLASLPPVTGVETGKVEVWRRKEEPSEPAAKAMRVGT